MVRIRNVTFRQLQVFESIARTGSFTAAADELFLTQPTVSIQIKKLTQSVTVPLFDYAGKKLQLTEAGKALLDSCLIISNELSRFEMTIANMKGVKQGTLRLTGVTTTEYFAPRILGTFSQKYPGINLVLNVINRASVLERIDNNQDDLYIIGGVPPKNLNVHVIPFLDNPLVVIAPLNHPLMKKRKILLKEIVNEPFILREPETGTSAIVHQLLREHNLNVNLRMVLGSNEAVKQAVIGGLGLSVLSKHAVVHEIVNRELVLLDVVGFPINHQWHIVYPIGKKLTVVTQAFLTYLLDEGKAIAEAHLYGNFSLPAPLKNK